MNEPIQRKGLTTERIVVLLRSLMHPSRKPFHGSLTIGIEAGRPRTVNVNETFKGDDEIELEA